ncbi:MAG TPA: hypothetical protein VKA69_09070 [Desulfobacteria bacterium]|nr:hypothetical protein [Desulfobacteria bacterium]
MSFLSLPTDNLYKFIALSGLAIIFLSFIPFKNNYENKIEKIQLSGDLKILEAEIYSYKNRTSIITEIMKLTQSDIKKLEMQRKKLEFMDAKSFSKHVQFEEQMNEFSNHLFDLTIKEHEYLLKIQTHSIELETKTNKIESISNRIKILLLISTIGFIIGTLLSIFGFVLWYMKCQKYLDRSVQNVKDFA